MSIEVKRRRFELLGCFQEAISTLLIAQKPATNAIYAKVWDKFLTYATGKGFDPVSPTIVDILNFLQTGFGLGLSQNSLKIQVSEISAATNTWWAKDSLMVTFLKGVLKMHSPTRRSFPKWDLPLILEVLSAHPFAPVDKNLNLDPNPENNHSPDYHIRQEDFGVSLPGSGR